MNEDELRLLICRSKKDGFKALFQQYQNYVYTIIWSRLRSIGTVEDAEECVSDVFAEVFIHFDEIHKGTLQGYISTLAKRTAIDRFRKLSLKDESAFEDEELENIADNMNVEEDIENFERNQILYEKIRSLGEPDATLIIQKYYYDRKSGDIAETLGMTAGTVRTRINRALKRLRKILTDENIQGLWGDDK